MGIVCIADVRQITLQNMRVCCQAVNAVDHISPCFACNAPTCTVQDVDQLGRGGTLQPRACDSAQHSLVVSIRQGWAAQPPEQAVPPLSAVYLQAPGYGSNLHRGFKRRQAGSLGGPLGALEAEG